MHFVKELIPTYCSFLGVSISFIFFSTLKIQI